MEAIVIDLLVEILLIILFCFCYYLASLLIDFTDINDTKRKKKPLEKLDHD